MFHSSYKTLKKCAMSLVLGMVLVVSSIPNAEALVITRNFTGGTAHASAVGSGTLQTVFNAAADVWESLILDNHVVSIDYQWAALAGGTLGVHSLTGQGGVPNRETSALIRFDNDGSSAFFMDGNTSDNSEYGTFNASFADLGGGNMNTGLEYSNASGLAAGRFDLFSIALHEIGHALGLSSANTAFQAENVDLDIDVMANVSNLFAGSVLGTRNGAHLDIANTLMYPFFNAGERKLISMADLLANCQVSQFTDCVGANRVSEPAPFGLLLLGGFALWLGRRRARSAA